MDCWIPTRTRCWLTLKNSNCSSAARWSAGNFDVIPIEPLNALPAMSDAAQMSVQSQNLLDAVQQTLSAARDSVSYSVAQGMTLDNGKTVIIVAVRSAATSFLSVKVSMKGKYRC